MTVTPQYVAKNVITGIANVYIQDWSSTSPPALPDENTHTLNTAWSDPWTPLGASESGATLRFTRETNDISIEEQVNPLDVKTQTLDPRLEITLSEDTLETMRIAYGGGTISETTPGAGQIGKKELSISQTLEPFAVGLEGENSNGFFRHVLFQKVVSIAEVETSYRRAETQRLYACSFRLISPVNEAIIKDKTAAAS